MAKGTIRIDQGCCKGCNLCAIACPKDLIRIAPDRLNTGGYHPAMLFDPNSDCTGCALCAVMCPEVCITVYREAPVKGRAPVPA
jgi:2-oxoglutarate ferredoxin oxidoreductase subunit delta